MGNTPAEVIAAAAQITPQLPSLFQHPLLKDGKNECYLDPDDLVQATSQLVLQLVQDLPIAKPVEFSELSSPT